MSILSTTKSGKSNYIIIHGANHFIEKATEQICDEVFNHNWEDDWQANHVMRFKFDFHLNMKFKKQYNDLFSEDVFICKEDGLSLYYRVYKSEYEYFCKKHNDEILRIIQNAFTRNLIFKIYNHIEYSKHTINRIEPYTDYSKHTINRIEPGIVSLIDIGISNFEHRKEDIFRKDMFTFTKNC